MTYGGALSFLRRPYRRHNDLNQNNKIDHKIDQSIEWAIVGVPFDQSVTNRSGARLGPQAIRAASVQLAELPAFPFGFDPFDYISVCDWGDIFLDPGYPDKICETIEQAIESLLDAGIRPLSLGGDHFITYPILRAQAKKWGPISLVHFDAHSDCWPDDGVRLDHGTMFSRAVKEGVIAPERSIQVGIRTWCDQAWCDQDFGFKILTAPDVHTQGTESVTQQILERVGQHPVYMTFDIDCLDPAFAPGTGTPVVGGLSSAQALAIVRGLGSLEFIGADVVEVAPAYDHAEITALAAATVAHDFLCLIAQKNREKASITG